MKKLARLTALLLTGALLLALTACGAAPLAPEQQAKQRLLGEINSYRATLEFAAPLEEVKQLSDAEQICRAVPRRRQDRAAREHNEQNPSEMGKHDRGLDAMWYFRLGYEERCEWRVDRHSACQGSSQYPGARQSCRKLEPSCL